MKFRRHCLALLPRRATTASAASTASTPACAPLCSPWVLASLGLLAALTPSFSLAQGAGGTLPAGTVPVLRGVVSGQAVMQAPRAVPGGQSLGVEQSSERAVLSWQSFNIARGSEVTVYHPSTTAATLNRIYGNDPSLVQGALKSRLWDPATRTFHDNKVGGQLVLVNQNGILFDRGSQVNAGALIASTLNISNSLFLTGVLNSATTAAFEGGYDDAGNPLATRPGGVRSGNIGIGSFGPATAAAPLIEVSAGGALYVFAPRVDNDSGVLRAPDGQVILAAGKKVFLTQNPNASDITLRGLVVEVEAEDSGAGLNLTNLVRNAGDISADRGNVSLAALAVNQEGRISAKTAVQASGSVYLTGRARASAGTGTGNTATTLAGQVTLARGSVTEVTPDSADRSTVADSADYQPFRGVVDVQAGLIASSGTVNVPGGRLHFSASNEANPAQARVYLAEGSLSSVAGAWADVDFAKHLATFRVTSNELKNAPDQKGGMLRGATVTVDLRRDNGILTLDGYRDTVARSVTEKAALGGELTIRSSGDVVQRSGATLDASGGGYRYGSGFASTTRLLGADGRVYDLANAPQALRYVTQLDRVDRVDERFNQTISYANPLGSVATFQPAYVQGLAGGTLAISSANGLVLDGVLKGGVTIGNEQLARAPQGATLRVGTGFNAVGNYNVGQRIGNIDWRQRAADTLGASFALVSALSASQRDSFTLAADQIYAAATHATSHATTDATSERREHGFGSVELNADGRIFVPASVSLTADSGASLLMNAQSIDIGGQLSLPAGNLVLRALDSPNAVALPAGQTAAERIILRSGATLSTAGAWINNASRDGSFVGTAAPSARLNAAGSATQSALNGGSITMLLADPTFQSRLERGSTLDVSGGAALASNQRLSAGSGGKLVVSNVAQSSSDWMQADLLGHALGSLGTGAELTLNLGRALVQAVGANGTLPSGTTRLEARLFNEQGFSKVSVNAMSDIEVTAGTRLHVRQDNFVLDIGAALALPTGASLRSVATPQTLPEHQRAAASVALSGGSVSVPEDAAIRTDARGQISLQATNTLRVGGTLDAPGGAITLTLRGPDALTASDLLLAPSARLSVAGVFVPTPNDAGLSQGTLHNAGTVTLTAAQAGLDIAAGAVVDLSAVNKRIDIRSADRSPALQQQTLVGHAGSVLLRSTGNTSVLGSFRAQGGDTSAAGASFALEFTRPDGQSTLGTARRIVAQQAGTAAGAVAGTLSASVDVNALELAGFDKLRLLAENQIDFQGSGSLDFSRGIRLDAPVIEVLGNTSVALHGANVALGQSIHRAFAADSSGRNVWTLSPEQAPRIAARSGNGLLTIDAGTVDFFGGLTLGGVQLTQVHSEADLRFIGRAVNKVVPGDDSAFRQLGWLQTAGSLELKADQVYPATRSSFSVEVTAAATDPAVPAPYLLLRNNGQTAGEVYSVAGSLSLSAPTIVNLGTIKAPQGELKLLASNLLELGAGSVTSVSGAGTTALYGSTSAGVTWQYADGGLSSLSTLSRVSATGKRIELQGAQQVVAAGATIDLRGGGDVLAVEFVPGNGGDRDITLADNTYAIVPRSQLAAMPFDADLQTRKDIGFGFAVSAGRDAVLYDGLNIGVGSSVAAGDYVLLPARYALLPGAYLVQLQTGAAYRNLQPGQTAALANANVVSAGHRIGLGTTVRESQSVGVVVLPGSAVRRSSDYTLSGAALFAQAAERERSTAPAAPWDAGRLLIAGASQLTLAGRFETSAGTSASATVARGAQVDIDGNKIALVGSGGAAGLPADFLQISSAAVSALNASVLIGGRRSEMSDGSDGVRISTGARELRVANDAASAIELPELLLSARSSIDIAAGSVLRAAGSATALSPGLMHAESSGALVRLSNGEQARVDRGVAAAASGDVRIGTGAVLSAAGSLAIDATRSTQSTGQLRAGGSSSAGGSLSLSSGLVSLGQTDAAAASLVGLVLNNADLSAYATLDELVLRGYQAIDLLGTTDLGSVGLKNLRLDTPLLRGVAVNGPATASVNQATLRAQSLTLGNSSVAVAATATGSGRLALQADTLTLGAGDLAVAGFDAVLLQVGTALRTDGVGALRTAVPMAIETPLLQAGSAAQHRLVALDSSDPAQPIHAAIRLRAGSAAPAATVTPAEPGLGGRIRFEGSQIEVATTVQARSGHIALQAVAHDNSARIVLAPGAVLDAGGQIKDFRGTRVAADGGSVTLSAAGGGIDLQRGAQVNVSAAAGTAAAARAGDAGRISLRAQTLELTGELSGHADATARSGSLAIDLGRFGAGSVADFSTLNTSLNQGGFAHERQLRLRSGDLSVAATDAVAARSVALSADTGRIDVAGTVGRGAPEGGASVTLQASSGLSLADGSQLLAQGSAVGARGGEVRASTRGGALVFAAGATIDVRSGDAGPAGSVLLGVARDSAGAINPARLQGLVRRHSAAGDSVATVDLEATRVVGATEVGSRITAAQIAAWGGEHAAFVSASSSAASLVADLRDDTGVLRGARVLGALELHAAGNLSLDVNWDLSSAAWLSAAQAGTLSIRAAGTLTLRETLGAPRLATNGSNVATNNANQLVNHAIRAADTWSVRLTAGADLDASDALATSSAALPANAAGDLLLSGANAHIRTGSGRIDLAAARHVLMDHISSSIYTAGRIGATEAAVNGNNRWAVDGGSISIRAGGNVAGPQNARDLWVTEWVRRPRLGETGPTGFGVANPTDWWSFRPRFQQAVGTLGGGDIDIRAGGDVLEFSAMLPTAGRTSGTVAAGTRQVQVTGGGNLTLQAGGNLVGGGFLLGRGTGLLEVAGDIGKGQPVQLYVMGASSGTLPEGASFELQAGGSLALKSVDNPTVLYLNASSGATGPSFHPTIASNLNDNPPANFYSYGANSAVGLLSKGGDVSYDFGIASSTTAAAAWRNHSGAAATAAFAQPSAASAYPPNLSIVALDGSIGRTAAEPAYQLKTYPSRAGSVVLLAQHSITIPNLIVSDLDPLQLITPTTRFASARLSTSTLSAPFDVGATAGKRRIVQRDTALPFAVHSRDADLPHYLADIQTLSGSISNGAADSALIVLPAVSRLRAGLDIVSVQAVLQNLQAEDVSEIRADSGDVRSTAANGQILIGGPGRLLVQAGRNIDRGTSVINTLGASSNPQLTSAGSARLTLIAGVSGTVDLARLDTPAGAAGAPGVYDELVALNRVSQDILDLYAQLGAESSAAKVLAAADVAALAAGNPAYARFVSLDAVPRALSAYQAALQAGRLPLAAGADRDAALALYRLLNTESDITRLQAAGSLAGLAAAAGGAVYRDYAALGGRYPLLFTDYLQRRAEGAQPTTLAPIVFSQALDAVVARALPSAAVGPGSILSFNTNVQTGGGSAIDLLAPGGDVVVGLTTPAGGNTIGTLTTGGGAVRSILAGDFNVNQGKVITAQGGDILIYSARGSIDAGRGAKTSTVTPPPTITRDASGRATVTFSGAATGSGIQSLSSDPDGLGPLSAAAPGNVYLFAPAGSIDAGEAGIRSGGNILINAQVVRNASDIRAGGSSQGVPQLQVGNLASALASSSGSNTGKAAEDSAKAAGDAARKAAAAPPPPKPTILSVEVLGFGDKNCKEDDKECFAK